jgi:Ca2+-binding EF-hand superfamily protein
LLTGKLNYIKFIDNVTGFGNKNHNPFKLAVQKIELFLENNKIDSRELLKRVGSVTEDGVTVQIFAQFLQKKIDKGKNIDDLEMISHMIDIDKDGYISNEDL